MGGALFEAKSTSYFELRKTGRRGWRQQTGESVWRWISLDEDQTGEASEIEENTTSNETSFL